MVNLLKYNDIRIAVIHTKIDGHRGRCDQTWRPDQSHSVTVVLVLP